MILVRAMGAVSGALGLIGRLARLVFLRSLGSMATRDTWSPPEKFTAWRCRSGGPSTGWQQVAKRNTIWLKIRYLYYGIIPSVLKNPCMKLANIVLLEAA